ncbi:PLC-like phosphodiesterase [Cercophora newfieldiana]|uniref:PLC-like phosphodiesterase n=1 Tax=Cercophora newfieldiana TaxID=92897 RepID=A0AA39XSV2_9PEZI|nr:PLC-like phosphodiesterase [Cercophora newfieldiana]
MGAGGYLQLVNGTPYAWKKVDHWTYQMNDATFSHHIAPFSTNTVYFEFQEPSAGNWFDCEAWMEYQMEGTSHRFRIWANRKHGLKLVLRLVGMNTVNNAQGEDIDLGFVQSPAPAPRFNGVTCIIAGRSGAFVTNASRNPLNHKDWMARALWGIGDLTLREVCIPGTHNSGMFKSSWSTTLGVRGNVLNQTQSIRGQLDLGVRSFDLRPALDEDGKWFYVHHISKIDGVGYQGALGEWIGYIVNQVNEFSRENAEVIILNISHGLNIHQGYRGFDQGDWERLFKEELDRLENRYVASPGEDITRVPIRKLVDGGRKAAVIVRFDYSDDDKNGPTLGGRHGNGYFYKHNFPQVDDYANANDPETLITNQVDKMKAHRNNERPIDGQVFVMGWAMTQKNFGDVSVGPSLWEWAWYAMMPRLGVLYDKCFGRCFPNIIGLDCVQTTDALAICFAINEWQYSKR